MTSPPPLDFRAAVQRARAAVRDDPLHLHYFDVVGSTNDVAATLAAAGAPEGTVVIAGRQTAGRGRRGNSWYSPAGSGLYMSLVLRPGGGDGRPAGGPEDVQLLTLMSGAAVAHAVEELTTLQLTLKWPNDLMVQEKGASPARWLKLGGILAEAQFVTGVTTFVILGIGINLRDSAHPAELVDRITSLEAATGTAVDAANLIKAVLVAHVQGRRDLLQGRRAEVVDRWRSYATGNMGRRVEWVSGGVRHAGIASDVDETGALVVQTPSGAERIVAGEVEWR
jgi:BirA family biotin operon repressor/biotin-[acetyl-CoA-carboxylase] ligase